jgi:hypothetical protein
VTGATQTMIKKRTIISTNSLLHIVFVRVVYTFTHVTSVGSGASEIARWPTSCMCTTCLAIVAAVNVLNVTNAFERNIFLSSGGDMRYWEDPSAE